MQLTHDRCDVSHVNVLLRHTNHLAVAFITDWRCCTRWPGMPDSVALPKSNRLRTSDDISDWRTVRSTDRRLHRSWRRIAKHDDTVLATCDLIDTSASMKMPRLRTTAVGATRSAPPQSNQWLRQLMQTATGGWPENLGLRYIQLTTIQTHPFSNVIDTCWQTDLQRLWLVWGTEAIDLCIISIEMQTKTVAFNELK